MNDNHMLSLWKRYQGVFYPLMGIAAVFLVLLFLSAIVGLDQASLPRPALNAIQDYPKGFSLEEMVLFTGAGMWWLLLSFFFWLLGLFAVGFCWYLLVSATPHDAASRKAVSAIFLSVLVSTIGMLIYISEVKGTPLMSFEFILRNLGMISSGTVALTSYNTALGIVVVAMLLLSASLLLLPGAYKNDATQQMRAITRIMYCGAAFLLTWVAVATEMYRFAAMMLVAAEREQILKLAPTISLMAGAFASLLLATAYISAYLWLQTSYSKSAKKNLTKDVSPKDFLLAHWPKVTALLMPVLPGAIGTVMSVFSQPM